MIMNFELAYAGVEELTLVNRRRCANLWHLATRAKVLGGDAAEFGVYKGGTALLLARALQDTKKTLHLFDSFDGLPKEDERDEVFKEGMFADTSQQNVAATLAPYKTKIHAGEFSGWAPLEASFCFAHLDCDLARSYEAAMEYFYPRMVRGGIIVMDEYGSPKARGVTKAVDAYLSENNEHATCIFRDGMRMQGIVQVGNPVGAYGETLVGV